MVGDMTNDGTAEQHELLKQCLEEVLSDKRVLSVTGNHDIPRIPPKQAGFHTDADGSGRCRQTDA